MKKLTHLILITLFIQGCTVINNYCKDPNGNILINTLSSSNPLAARYGSAIICTSYQLIKEDNITE